MEYPTELVAKAKYELHVFERVAMDTGAELVAEVERLRDLVRRALPMATALDATKTAVVWTVDLQVDATMLVRDMRAALKA